jgi:predicted transcriptional regulator
LRVPVGAGAVERAVGTVPRTLAEDLAHADEVYGRLRYETAVVGTLRDGLLALEEGDVYDHEEVMAELRGILFP